MGIHKGDSLYHYTRLSIALEHILQTGEIKLSSLTSMRDPRESLDWLPTYAATEGVEWTKDTVDEFRSELRRAKSCIKVLSLTESLEGAEADGFDESGFGYAHARLWEQYADAHKGVCLVFDRESLFRQLAKGLGPERALRAASIEYTNEPLIPGVTSQKVAELGVHEAVSYLIEKRFDELVFRKTPDWTTEVEFRVAVRTADADDLLVPVRESIRAVIVGSEMALAYLPSLRAVCGSEIAVQRMWWQNGEPWLFSRAPAFPPDPTAPLVIHAKTRIPAGNPENW
jgi:Protein of unknown function (DUF2971)